MFRYRIPNPMITIIIINGIRKQILHINVWSKQITQLDSTPTITDYKIKNRKMLKIFIHMNKCRLKSNREIKTPRIQNK